MLLNILKWGTDPTALANEKITIEHHRDVVELLLKGLYGRATQESVAKLGWPPQASRGLREELSKLPSLASYAAYLGPILAASEA